jgi:hypothetical protein
MRRIFPAMALALAIAGCAGLEPTDNRLRGPGQVALSPQVGMLDDRDTGLDAYGIGHAGM